MLYLSEVLMQNHDLKSFSELLTVIDSTAKSTGEVHLNIDVKPSYPDTPNNWEDRIEGAFAGVYSVTV